MWFYNLGCIVDVRKELDMDPRVHGQMANLHFLTLVAMLMWKVEFEFQVSEMIWYCY